MGTRKNSSIGDNQSAGDLTPQKKDVGGKRLRLNKQTLQDLSPTEASADTVRGGVNKTPRNQPCTMAPSGCATGVGL